jgi:hypothetical protein
VSSISSGTEEQWGIKEQPLRGQGTPTEVLNSSTIFFIAFHAKEMFYRFVGFQNHNRTCLQNIARTQR